MIHVAEFLAPGIAPSDPVGEAHDVLAPHGVDAPSLVVKELETSTVLTGEVRGDGSYDPLAQGSPPGGVASIRPDWCRRQAGHACTGAIARGVQAGRRHGASTPGN